MEINARPLGSNSANGLETAVKVPEGQLHLVDRKIISEY